jgi:hypothetical protein
MKHGVWFPDEEMCHRREYRNIQWVSRQFRIAKATGLDSFRGCFTVAMLERNCRITTGIRGLDPDDGEINPERVEGWIRKHAAVRAWTDEERAVARARLEKIEALKSGRETKTGPGRRTPVTSMAKTEEILDQVGQ